MFREHRNSPAAQRAVHGKSNQPPPADTGSPVANENDSPNHAATEKIKAWKGSRTSGIPSAPSPRLGEAVAVTPKQNPVGVTPVNERVSTLQAIKNQLQDRLESERQLQIDAVKQLEYIGDGDEVCLCFFLSFLPSFLGKTCVVMFQNIHQYVYLLCHCRGVLI